jgi:glycosyltransferase involved in cell wall biosynthesis
MGEKLRSYTVKNFSWSAISSRLVKLFEEAIEESRAGC